jgi:AraC-like DNA-binding protein/quercetin dioxygenase-like cupin family protein
VLLPSSHSAARVAGQTAHDADARVSNWAYVRPEGSGVIEYAYWTDVSGSALRPHFHDELQITLVLSGVRLFRVGGYEFRAGAGSYVVIPPGCPHQATTPPGAPSSGVSVYLAGARVVGGPSIAWVDAADWPRVASDREAQIAAMLRGLQPRICGDTQSTGEAWSTLIDALQGTDRLAEIAERRGESREHFGRRFKRLFDISPHRYRLVDRLNLGRKRLREGEAITDVVTDLGFADQSHFTRLFRATFGTTPGDYRKGRDGSHSF